jgi:multiple sugar transport system substrate-binding protein
LFARSASLVGSGPLLAACAAGSGSTETALPATKPTGTVTFWHNWNARTDIMQKWCLDPFMQAFPGVVVEPTTFTTAGGREKVVAAVLAGTPPDCLHLQRESYPLLIPAKAVVSLDKYMARDKVDPKIFVEADLKSRTVNGQIYSLPSISGTGFLSLYYNKAHFRQAGLDPNKPPQTWGELETYAQRLTVGQGDSLQRLGMDHAQVSGPSSEIHTSRFVGWLYGNDGNLVSADGRKVAFDSKEGADALNWMIQLARRLGVENLQKAGGQAAFFQGRLSMYPQQDNLPSLLRLDPVAKDMEWGVAPVPVNDRNAKARLRLPTAGGHGYSVMSGAKNMEAAWQLTKWLTAGDAQCNFMTLEQGRVSPLKACSAERFALARPEFQVFAKLQGSVIALPFFPDTAWIRLLDQQVLDAVTGKTSPDVALRTAAQQVQAALDESWQNWRG